MKKIFIAAMCFLFVSSPVYAVETSAKAACLICADTGEVIFAENERERLPMASTTKIMTGLLAAESGKMQEIVTVSANAQRQEGSSIYLRCGDKLFLNDLTYGLMLNSGNDAAVAIAEYLSGDVKSFCDKMTERAEKIGAFDTQFKNPNGLEEAGHYTTAYDLALIGAEAMHNDTFAKIVSTKNINIKTNDGMLHFNNHNKLLNRYDGAVGIKTGFTKAAGRCLVSAAEKDGIMLIAVTLNDPNDWEDHKIMLDYGFERAKCKTIVKKGDVLKKIKSGNMEYTFSAGSDLKVGVVSKNDFELRVCMPEKLPVPVAAGEKTGIAKLFAKGRYIGQIDIVSDSDIEQICEKTFFDAIKKVISGLI